MKSLFIYFCFFSSNCQIPSIIPNVEIKGIKNFGKKTWILQKKLEAEVAYYCLYYKSNDPMEIINYIDRDYTNFKINEKSLLYGLFKLGQNTDNIHLIIELQNKIEKIFPQSKYLWFGNFVLALHYLYQISNNPKNNFNNIANVIFSLGTLDTNKKYKRIVFFIANYYLSEHYLFLMKEHFNLRDFNGVLIYGQKILLRFNIHPKCAMEALIIFIETFFILDCDDLADFYSDILIKNVNLNPSLKFYSLRLQYLKQVYNKK